MNINGGLYMSSRMLYKIIFSISMITLFSGTAHAIAPFQIWTPSSGRPIMTVDLMYARSALKKFQATLQGYCNGVQSGTYVTGYLSAYINNANLMKNAQLFVDSSRWQSIQQRITQLDALLSTNQTTHVQTTLEVINILEECKRDINQRLEAIAINSRMAKRGPVGGRTLYSPAQLNQIHSARQQQLAQRQAQKNMRTAIPNNQPQPVPTQTSPTDSPEEQIKQQLMQAGLTPEQITQLHSLLEKCEQNPEAINELATFIKNLPKEQQEALFKLNPQLKEALQKLSPGLFDMIKQHPWMTTAFVAVAAAAITWGLMRNDEPGAVFGQKMRSMVSSVWNWITGKKPNEGDQNPVQQPAPQPNPVQPQQPDPAQPQVPQQPNPAPLPEPQPTQPPQNPQQNVPANTNNGVQEMQLVPYVPNNQQAKKSALKPSQKNNGKQEVRNVSFKVPAKTVENRVVNAQPSNVQEASVQVQSLMTVDLLAQNQQSTDKQKTKKIRWTAPDYEEDDLPVAPAIVQGLKVTQAPAADLSQVEQLKTESLPLQPQQTEQSQTIVTKDIKQALTPQQIFKQQKPAKEGWGSWMVNKLKQATPGAMPPLDNAFSLDKI